MWRKRAMVGVGLLIVGFVLIQIVPMGAFISSLKRDENPPIEIKIQWDSPETEALIRTACYDCHSNETVWPWYSYIAPASWLVVHDVNDGRGHLNFSRTNIVDHTLQDFLDDVTWHIQNNMPPRKYLILHPDAALNDEQQAQLIAGITTTITGMVESGQLAENTADGDTNMNMDTDTGGN